MFLANVCLEKYTVYFDRCVMFDNVWWWPVRKNLSHLHFIHWMCEVTSFYQDEILMFTRNPSTGEKSSKNFQPIQCLWNVSYYIGALRTNFFNIFWKHRSPRNGVMDRTMSFSPWTKPRWTTQMDYPSNFTNPSMFFHFVFVSHNEHHES